MYNFESYLLQFALNYTENYILVSTLIFISSQKRDSKDHRLEVLLHHIWFIV